MKRTKKSKKGFTLIELIVVVAILAILAAIAIPNFIGMTKKANTATEVAAASELASAINIHNTLAKGNPASYTLITAVASANSTVLGNLYPTIDSNITIANVTSRITIDATGIASVTDKGDK